MVVASGFNSWFSWIFQFLWFYNKICWNISFRIAQIETQMPAVYGDLNIYQMVYSGSIIYIDLKKKKL